MRALVALLGGRFLAMVSRIQPLVEIKQERRPARMVHMGVRFRFKATLPGLRMASIMEKPIASIMRRMVNPVAMDDTVEEVETVLNTHGFSSVPVYDADGVPLGIISLRDLLHFHAGGRDPKQVHAWEICTYKPVEVAPDATISEVAELMLNHHVHHVIVVENGHLKGIVSSLDFVRLFLGESQT